MNEGVSPIKNGDFPASQVSFRGGYIFIHGENISICSASLTLSVQLKRDSWILGFESNGKMPCIAS